ncbi:MAG: tetratricopeptide repeat protein [Ktedonobacteraceae bacterium]|nr:tetratricopeptide repeat protein [Ktedonobacteraceae bacterium]
MLLTTRMQALGKRASPILITSMDTDGSTLFLLRRAKILAAGAQLQQVSAKVVREANAIAQVVGGYPLALDQVGAFLEEKGCSLTTYLKLYQEQGTKLLGEGGQQADDHQRSVANTLMLAIEQVTQKDALNLELLHLLAFLHPDAIPEGLLTDGAAKLRKPLQAFAKDPLLLQDALADLRRFSLIHNSIDREILQIHRVVQDVLIDRLTKAQQRQWARQVVHLVNFVFPEVRFDTWATCELYLPQAKRCADLIDKFRLTSIEGASLLERLGNYLSQRGFYIDAETYLSQSLHLYEKQPHTNPSDLAQTLNSLGLLYSRQAQFHKAESHHQRALELRERTLDADHPKVAESLHNLALVYAERGEYQQAEQTYQRVLAIEEQTKGAGHPDVASTLNNLGMTYFRLKLYSQAEAAYKRALTIYELSRGINYPYLIYPLDGLGALAEMQGNYQQAEGFYQRALVIAKKAFGDKHIETAHSINKVADIALAQGNDAKAEEFYQQALSIGEKVLRPGHPDIALFLSNLAFLANKQKQYQKAESLYQRALNIYEKALGSEHPDTVLVREQYNALLKRMNQDFS